MTKYRFYITDKDRARAELQSWAGRVNVCVADVLRAGYIDQYICTVPEVFAHRIGADSWVVL